MSARGNSRWQDQFLRHFDALWGQWQYEDELRCCLWTHDLYGVTEKRLGALHGLASIAFPIIRGRHLLPRDRSDESLRRICEALRATALTDGEFINWPNNVGPSTRPLPLPILVQHCNGAPGTINCVAEFPDDLRWGLDSMLLRAGEFIWQAGPLAKFPSLCHGAPGNGYAFLKLYARTGDRRWLDRARQFAMHSIDQCERAHLRFGQRKFSLWTGDLLSLGLRPRHGEIPDARGFLASAHNCQYRVMAKRSAPSRRRSKGPFLRRITLVPERVDRGQFPFSFAAFSHGIDLELASNVTFFVGENGSGKSTLLEALAEKSGFNPEGGSRDHR